MKISKLLRLYTATTIEICTRMRKSKRDWRCQCGGEAFHIACNRFMLFIEPFCWMGWKSMYCVLCEVNINAHNRLWNFFRMLVCFTKANAFSVSTHVNISKQVFFNYQSTQYSNDIFRQTLVVDILLRLVTKISTIKFVRYITSKNHQNDKHLFFVFHVCCWLTHTIILYIRAVQLTKENAILSILNTHTFLKIKNINWKICFKP